MGNRHKRSPIRFNNNNNLATGDSQTSISFNFRVGRSTVCTIVYETCRVLWKVLRMEYVQFPSTTQDWIGISQQFWRKWNFPNCLGAIDGKHITIRAPDNTGTAYFNNKKSFSICLMAVASADYKFITIDVGQVGSASDGGIWERSRFGEAWKYGKISHHKLSYPNKMKVYLVVQNWKIKLHSKSSKLTGHGLSTNHQIMIGKKAKFIEH